MLSVEVVATVVAFALIVDVVFLYLSWQMVQGAFGY